MIRQTRSLTSAVVLASLAVSCGWPEHRLRVLHDALRLTVTGPERIVSGARTTVTLSLRNVSAEVVDVCIGPSKDIVVGSAMLMTHVDPERCERRLTLGPSAESTWDETFETPFAPAGPNELEVGLRIAEPTFCFGGCFTTSLSGQRTVVVE